MKTITGFLAALVLALTFAQSASASTPVDGTSGFPYGDAVVFNGSMYVFFNWRSYVASNGGLWSPAAQVPVPSSIQLRVRHIYPLAFNNKLYAFWSDSDSGDIYYTTMDQYGIWDGLVTRLPNANGWGIGGAVFENKLYVAWRAGGNNTSIFYATIDSTGVWSSTAHLSTAESDGGVTATVFRGNDSVDRLYFFWKDRNDFAQQMWYTYKTAGSAFGTCVRLNTPDYPLTDSNPSVVSNGSTLFLTYKGGYNGDILVKKMDGNFTWANENVILNDLSVSRPSTIFYNNNVMVFYGNKTNNDVEYEITY